MHLAFTRMLRRIVFALVRTLTLALHEP